jgi:glyoxylase-like metal-dependent hydrolase (beta-lactamase superfamily II)
MCSCCAETFGCPVYVSKADAEFVTRPFGRLEQWEGDSREIVPGVTMHRLGGHFPGSCVLHWSGQDGKGVLMTGG